MPKNKGSVIMQKVMCDECEKDFTLKLRTKDHGISIKEHYFLCSNCKKKYVAFVTDPECRKMQKQINQIHESKNDIAALFAKDEINEQVYRKLIDELDAEIKAVLSELEPRMNKLKMMYT